MSNGHRDISPSRTFRYAIDSARCLGSGTSYLRRGNFNLLSFTTITYEHQGAPWGAHLIPIPIITSTQSSWTCLPLNVISSPELDSWSSYEYISTAKNLNIRRNDGASRKVKSNKDTLNLRNRQKISNGLNLRLI